VLAGPSVASFFAELGARVVKIENTKTGGDVTRSWKNSKESNEEIFSSYYAAANFGKEILMMDLSDMQQRKDLDRWLYTSDIVITNFKSGDEEKFRLTSADIHKINPTCIHAKIKGFTYDTSRIAYDVVLQAETGYMHMNGEKMPTKIPVALIDILAAHQLKQGILCGLLEKHHTGKGCIVSCSLEDAGISGLVNQASNYLMQGLDAERMGSLHPNISPYGEVIRCANETSVVLAVGSDKQFHALCRCIGMPDLADDIRFRNNASRVANRVLLQPIIEEKMSNHHAEYWMQQFIECGVPAGEIKRISQVLNSPAGKSMVMQHEISGNKMMSVKQIAFKIDSSSSTDLR
jgi:crotonobetainyl-CoA:carnitine CoA-transferase CaiB-like acyl-CoA transferase